VGPPPPLSYLVSFLLDSTVGLLLIYLLLKAVAWLVNRFQITPLRSGEYGVPFRPHYWLAQCSVYLVVMLVMKLIVGPLVAFKFWKEVDEVILPTNEHLRIAIVMFIVPLVVNVSNRQLNCLPLAEPSFDTLTTAYRVEVDVCGCVRATTIYHTPVTLKYDSVVNETSLMTQYHCRSSESNMCMSFQWLWKSHLVLFTSRPCAKCAAGWS